MLHARNFIASGALQVLRGRGHHVEALGLEPTFVSPGRRAIRARLRLASLVERAKRGAKTYRHKISLPRPLADRLQIRVWRALGRFCDVEAVARDIEARLPVPRAAWAILDRYRPDLILWPTLIHSDPADDLAKAAQSRGIPVVAAPASWDTLTTKGGFLVRPDHIFVWGQASARHAERDHGLPAGQIHVTGPPHWDHYCEPRAGQARTTILVAGTTLNYWADEQEMVERLVTTFGEMIVYRKHPRASGGFSHDWQRMLELRDQLDRTICVVAAFSTVIVEAALLGIPSVVVSFGRSADGAGGLAVHHAYEHMAEVLAWPGVFVCRSYSALADRIQYVLDERVPPQVGTMLTTCAREVADVDGHCRERIAEALETIA